MLANRLVNGARPGSCGSEPPSMTIQWSESLRWVIRNAGSHSTRRQYHPTRLETQEPSVPGPEGL